MFSALKGGPLVATVVVVVAIIAAATVLAYQHVLSGSDWLVIASPVLAGGAAIGGAHVGASAANGQQSPPVVAEVPQNGPPASAATVGISAMPPPN